jgi:L-lactate dehydrogenase complex protein LldE
MTDQRPSPKGKIVSLFVTCIVDMIYPQTGMSVVKILEHLNLEINFPLDQTCCGQPAFNAGYQADAKTVAIQFLHAFAEAEVIVTPSGSCAAMIQHEYPKLFADDPKLEQLAKKTASITWEFTEFLVDGLGITDIGAKLPQKQSLAFHDACHGLRMLGLGKAGRELISNLKNAEIHEMTEADVCCGFGGLFAVKMANISNAMLQTKMKHISETEAKTIITGDASCLTQMNGGLSRQGSQKRVRHLADVLADGIE